MDKSKIKNKSEDMDESKINDEFEDMDESKIDDESEDEDDSEDDSEDDEFKNWKRSENVDVLEDRIDEFVEFMKDFHSVKSIDDLIQLCLMLVQAETVWKKYTEPDKNGDDPLPKNLAVNTDRMLPAMAKANHLAELFDENFMHMDLDL